MSDLKFIIPEYMEEFRHKSAIRKDGIQANEEAESINNEIGVRKTQIYSKGEKKKTNNVINADSFYNFIQNSISWNIQGAHLTL